MKQGCHFLLALAFLIFITGARGARAQEIIFPDEVSVKLQCAREDNYLLEQLRQEPAKADAIGTLRIALGQLCEAFYQSQLDGDGWIAKFDAFDQSARTQLSNGQARYLATDINSLPVGLTSYSVLLLPNRFSTTIVTQGQTLQLVSAFESFSKKTNAYNAGVVFVRANNTPDLDLSTQECKRLFELPYCGYRIFLVTTKTRPDLWAKSQHSSNAMIFDLTFLSDRDATCFMKIASQDANINLANSANIVATLKAVANKIAVPKPLASGVEDAIVKPTGWVGQLEFYVVGSLLRELPCGAS